jgi:hypothetical protein
MSHARAVPRILSTRRFRDEGLLAKPWHETVTPVLGRRHRVYNHSAKPPQIASVTGAAGCGRGARWPRSVSPNVGLQERAAGLQPAVLPAPRFRQLQTGGTLEGVRAQGACARPRRGEKSARRMTRGIFKSACRCGSTGYQPVPSGNLPDGTVITLKE